MYSFIAVIIGMIISVMLSFNGLLEERVGTSISLIIIHVVGLVTISTLLLVKKEKVKLSKKIPIYMYCGGLVGVVLTLVNITTINAVGVALTTALAVFGQLIFSALIDHFGWFGMKKYPFNKKKIIGFLIIFIGLIVMSV